MKSILIAKLTSLGDIIFALPMVDDLQRQFPEVQIDWLVDAQFAELPAMHSGIRRVISVPLRGFKKRTHKANLQGVFAAVKQLRMEQYDVVLDCHGMIKSALLSKAAHADAIIGPPDARLGEAIARYAYDRQVMPDSQLPGTEWYRAFAGLAMNYDVHDAPSLGLKTPSFTPDWLPTQQPFVLCFHAASKAEKQWPMAYWAQLLQALEQAGITAILPWGSEHEHQVAQQIAAASTLAVVPPRMSLSQITSLIQRADWSIGVDTGLTHLAESLHCHSVALYTQTDAKSYHPDWNVHAYSLGGGGVIPLPEQVLAILGIAPCRMN
ncbi:MULTISPECIES: lipopolysaccharide heptosyltransferase I [Deefgea]|uniref:Lipopolysaccharide heptosyltransferase 1 n=1 Tax=Deefgea chitinilytica TaxID=570276 RepID=A0ABS2CES5_9NEIS|nr:MULTISPECIES: lipopolysaccharide heptosyltransferase I [Deefgea]MBM5571958.1 lipopolysaccharide heptosyltransferase I [Deefgea chitinilytica]MBM9889193.1 lipopolysaccharide heptosyltransferase I [Deefgea sp. CFH1-16]